MLQPTLISICCFLLLALEATSNQFDRDVTYELKKISVGLGSCGSYFHYSRSYGFITGTLEMPYIQIGDTVRMQFDRKSLPKHVINFQLYKGSLLPDENESLERLLESQTLTYRVDFPLTATTPRLEIIYLNGDEFCSTQFSGSEEKLILEHTLNVKGNKLPVFMYNINIPHFAEPSTCGLVDLELTGGQKVTPFIFGGKMIRRGEFPWLTAIYRKDATGLTFICGGSLITSQTIITAAHCFDTEDTSGLTADNLVVYLGHHNLTSFIEDKAVIRGIEALKLHPEYKAGKRFSDADLALLTMKFPVSFTQVIKPVCIWNEPTDESLIVNQTAVVAGWGADEEGNRISMVPKSVEIKIVSESVCLRSDPIYAFITSERTLCAGNGDDSGPCEGDSGGGLVLNRNGRWTLRGVISAGITFQQRCNLQQYTVYCDVAKHHAWLRDYIDQQDQPITSPIRSICGKVGKKSRSKQPWLAAIYLKTFTGERYYCTGALISSRSVLATAHCFGFPTGDPHEADYLRIYLGRYDLSDMMENTVVTRDVAALIRHPRFRSGVGYPHYAENDLAVLQMKESISFTQHVTPICLWSGPTDQYQIVDHSVTLSGWDSNSIYSGSLSVPQSIDVKVLPLQQCQGSDYNVTTFSQLLCTPRSGDTINDILMVKRHGRWQLRSVGSVTSQIDITFHLPYRVYFDIAEYLPWIESLALA